MSQANLDAIQTEHQRTDVHADGAEPVSRVQLKRSLAGLSYDEQVARLSPPVPGPIQCAGSTANAETIRATAASGLRGSAAALPHLGRIQQAFGSHDVSAVQAHTDDSARRANQAMGAKAYATGNQIAFNGAPDLRTAAHEAAHVVQQRHGVSLPGGVGKAGDGYERHADAVADAVVSGRSAKPLLDGVAGSSGGGGSVQMLRGHDAAVRSETTAGGGPAGGTVGDVMNEKVREGTHDENWNNKWKVEFENKLAAKILGGECAGLVVPPVDLVSTRMLAYLTRKAKVAHKEAFEDALKKDLETMSVNLGRLGENANHIYYGRLYDSIPPERLTDKVKEVLQGGGSLPQKLFTQHQFLDHIWDGKGEGDYFKLQEGKLLSESQKTFAELGFKLQELGPKELRDAPEVKEWFDNRGRFDAKHDKEAKKKADEEGRPAPAPQSRAGEVFGNPHGTSTATPSGISARAGEGGDVHATDADFQAFKDQRGSQIHSRGIDRLTMDESSKFIQEARLILDMPMAGSVSGTTVDLMTIASVFDLSVDEKKLYAIAVLGHLESAGAHSFHEIALAASAVPGVNYTPGEYRSFLPASIQAIVSDLLSEYGI